MLSIRQTPTKVPRRRIALFTPLIGGLVLTAAVQAQDAPPHLPIARSAQPLLAVVVPLAPSPDAAVPSLWQLLPCPDLPHQTMGEVAPGDAGVLQPVMPPYRAMWCAQPVPAIAVEWVQSILGWFRPQVQGQGE